MSEIREEVVCQAFSKLDSNGSGNVNIDLIKDAYNPRGHPDVQEAKKTEDSVLQEFLESFETYHKDVLGKRKDFNVTKEEFEEYYSNQSSVIDDDDYFMAIVKGVWELSEEARIPSPQQERASEISEKSRSPVKPKAEETPKVASQVQSGRKKGYANVPSADNTLPLSSKLYDKLQYEKKEEVKKSTVDSIFENLRKKLSSRGVRGLIGLAKQFKVMFVQINVE
jgi:hypothetical protein